jgi:hypothetical protein
MPYRRQPPAATISYAAILVTLLAGVLSVPAPAGGEGWATNPPRDLDPAEIDRAIDKGIEYLLGEQNADGSWPGRKFWSHQYDIGPSAIICYALLEAGVNPQNPKLEKGLEWMASQPSEKTYTLSLRANALLATLVPTRGKYRKVLVDDVRNLVLGTVGGAYTYDAPPSDRERQAGRWDNSNAQYGLLGVWAGARAGLEIPTRYWKVVLEHWLSDQNPDGGWGYAPDNRPHSQPAMTTAGLASLFVCIDNVMAEQFVRCATNREIPSLVKGLDWMEKHFPASMKKDVNYYYLYGVERVGLASGYKYFGTIDWFQAGARKLLGEQRGDGHWETTGNYSGDDNVATAFALLFLARGRNPVLFNKLRFKADWNNRPRDLASLTRWISRQFERTVNWQIINLDVPVRQWHDAPILYLSASKAPTFTDEQIDKLRRFVHQGGTLFSCTECNGLQFRRGIREVYQKLFPDYELTALGPDHPLYSIYFELRGFPRMHQISNGVRPLVIHTDVDLPRAWQLRQVASGRRQFEAAANLYMYVTDKGALQARGANLWPPAPQGSPSKTVTVARLAWGGNDNPEPLAWERLGRWLAYRTPLGVKVVGPMDPNQLADSGAQLAHLTGTGTLNLTDDQRGALREWLESGGTLLVEAAGGDEAFARSARELVGQLSDPPLRFLRPSHELYHLEGMKIEKVAYRRITDVRLGRKRTPNLQAVRFGDRLGILYSREDLSAGVVGVSSAVVDGYEPASAREIMRNITAYAAGRAK